MLDSATLEQLQTVFSRLDDSVILKVAQSTHANQEELLEMLRALESTSPLLTLEENFGTSPVPRFEVHRSTGPTGMAFRGVPGGHEFTSLILAVLYANGKGKQPDEGILQRIRNIRGPVRLKTFMSLSCENCPEVVQALHLMASHHEDFQHEVIDGAVAQDEIQALGIQGVPAVIHDGKLLHSGKSTLLDLLSKLEEALGTVRAVNAAPASLGLYDVVVIGGGPAGASAAIYSVRKGLSTALIAERFGGQLQDTKGIENMISMPYTEGVKLAAQLAEHLGKYPVKTFEHRRVASIAGEEIKRITLESGEYIDASAVIVATGAKWRELGVPGEKEHIGQGVAFCAHCDGPFYKGRRVAVVGGGNSGVEAAIDLAAIASHVTLLEYNDSLKADGVLVEKLKTLPNAVILTQVKSSRVIGEGGKVIGLEYHDRSSGETRHLDVDGVFVQIGLLPNTQFLKGVVELTPYGEIVVDAKGRTSVPGIYAAGDVTTIPFKQIVTAMGDGAKVALTAFEDRMRGSNRPDAGASRPAS
jgi:alkyl hydroperoxide reductase subunit F